MRKGIKASRWNLRTRQEKIYLSVIFVLFAVYAATLIYPFVWTAYNSLKSTREFNSDQFTLPTVLKWENYEKAFSVRVGNTNIVGALINSVWMTVGSVAFSLAVASLTAYVVAKYRFPGATLVYSISVFIQTIPLVGTMPANYELLHMTLGIANKPLLWWITWTGGFGFSFLMLYSAYKNLSWNYAEAAFIDGASHIRVYAKIMLPMVKPMLVAMAVVNAITAWNDYMTSYMYMTDYPTLALAVYSLSSQASRIGIPVYFSIIILTVIPTLIIFAVFQETIMQNMTTGGLKG